MLLLFKIASCANQESAMLLIFSSIAVYVAINLYEWKTKRIMAEAKMLRAKADNTQADLVKMLVEAVIGEAKNR